MPREKAYWKYIWKPKAKHKYLLHNMNAFPLNPVSLFCLQGRYFSIGIHAIFVIGMTCKAEHNGDYIAIRRWWRRIRRKDIKLFWWTHSYWWASLYGQFWRNRSCDDCFWWSDDLKILKRRTHRLPFNFNLTTIVVRYKGIQELRRSWILDSTP